MSTCAQTVIMTAVANWFRRKAGLAIGITASGFGLGGLLVPVVTKMIDVFGWRTAMFALGLAALAVILPLALLIRHKPEPYGYQPDGDHVKYEKIESYTITASNITEISISPWKAVRNRAFWNIAIGSMCHSFVIGAIITHVMPYLGSLGVSRVYSSLVALILPVASIGGRLSSGWFADKFGSRQVFAASFIAMTVGLFVYGNLTAGMLWLIIPFIIIFSLGWGCSVTSRLSLLREYFGRERFGTILGFLSGIMMVGSISGSPLAGWIFDTFNSYKGAWFGYCGVTVLGAVLVLTIPPLSASNSPSSNPREI
jgi:MFS family permease